MPSSYTLKRRIRCRNLRPRCQYSGRDDLAHHFAGPDGHFAVHKHVQRNCGGSNSVNVTYSQVVRTNTSGQIRKRASAAATTIYVHTFGWVDRRGKDT